MYKIKQYYVTLNDDGFLKAVYNENKDFLGRNLYKWDNILNCYNRIEKPTLSQCRYYLTKGCTIN